MKIKNTGKLIIFIGAAAALAASLINDKKNIDKFIDDKEEKNNETLL